MVSETGQSIVIPEVRVYEARRGEDIVLKDISVDTYYACDSEGRVMYFNLDEGKSYLEKRGKSLASLPLLVNLYIALDELARQDEVAAQVLHQLNAAWDRTGTSISAAGRIVHSDAILGEITYEGLTVPQEASGNIVDLFGKNEQFFQALLGVRDTDRLADVATMHDLVPYYWYPRGERLVMFGGGDFYYMHHHIPDLLMVFCDDEPHPRRVARGVWVGR